jgi:hypothetical protein
MGGIAGADYLAYVTPSGSSWGSVSSFVPSYGTGAVISDIAWVSNTMFVAGSFPSAAPRGGSAVAMLDTITWQGLGSAPVGSNPFGVAYAVNYDASTASLYVGGPFADAGGVAAADYLTRFQRSNAIAFAVATDSGAPDYTPGGAVPADGDGVYDYVDAFQTATGNCDRAYTVTPTDLGAAVEYDFNGGGWFEMGTNRLVLSEYFNTVTAGTPVTITIRTLASDASQVMSKTMRVICTRSQAITFAAISDQSITTGTLALGATASSSLATTYSSGTPGICTVAGATVTFVSAGTCTITAAQAGNAIWAAATSVSRSFQITAAPTPSAGAGSGSGSGGDAGGGTPTAAVATPAARGPAAPGLGKVTVRARRAAVSFAAAAGVTYAIRASSGVKVRTGTCRVLGAVGTCSVQLTVGTWLLTVTPTQGGVTGAAGTKAVRIK